MSTGSGLCSQFGVGEETTVGTAVAPSRFYAVNSGGLLELEKTTKVSEGLRACQAVQPVDRRVVVSRSASGDVEIDVLSKGFGLLAKYMLGSTATAAQVDTSTVYRQIHTNGALTGMSLTLQAGAPESYTGTVQPFTSRGAKITDWELGCESGGLLTAKLSLDAFDVATDGTLAAAAYPTAAEVFDWAQLSITIGGTVALASGLASLTGGAALKGCRGVTLKGSTKLATDRMLAGGGGIKAEQVENGWREYTGELDTEFADRAQIYDLFDTDATTALEFVWIGSADIGGGAHARLSLLYPNVKLDKGSPEIGGPDILDGKAEFSAYADPAGALPAVQLVYESTDTTV